MGGCGWKWHTCLFFVISPCGVVGKGFGTKEIIAKSTAVTGTGISRPHVRLGCICQNMRFCIKHEVFNFGGGNISLSVLLKCLLLPSLSANNTLIIISSFRWLDIRQPLVCHISAMCRQIHKVGCFTPLGKRGGTWHILLYIKPLKKEIYHDYYQQTDRHLEICNKNVVKKSPNYLADIE